MTQMRDLIGPIDICQVADRLREQLVRQLGYAQQKTLAGGIEAYE
jgi:lipoyl(octanoyl) transferase